MKKMGAHISAMAVVLLLVPVFVFAQEDFGEINSFFGKITTFINSVLIPLVFALALLAFLYGAFKYFIWGGADATSRSEGTQLMIYAIVGFVLMVSIFGIVNLIADGFGFRDENIGTIPDAPTKND